MGQYAGDRCSEKPEHSEVDGSGNWRGPAEGENRIGQNKKVFREKNSYRRGSWNKGPVTKGGGAGSSTPSISGPWAGGRGKKGVRGEKKKKGDVHRWGGDPGPDEG